MNLPFHIARRYLFAKKSTNAVNWITGISAVGVMVGTAAMVIVLSAFAGLDQLVRSFYTNFDPDLKVIPAEGKFAVWTDSSQTLLEDIDWIIAESKVVEDKALLRFREREYIGIIKGVDANFMSVAPIDSFIVEGSFDPTAQGDVNYGLFGSGVASYIGVHTLRGAAPVNAYVPKMGSLDRLNPMGNVSFAPLYPGGFFQIQPEFDTKYVFTTIQFNRDLFDLEEDMISAVEIKVEPGQKLNQAKAKLSEILGDDWEVKTRDDLQVAIFKVLQSEGLITYLVLTFILLVASFGILSSVNILILEKKKDLHTLWSMGATERLLRRIFMVEGLLISLGGAFIGFLIGIIVVLLQKHIGLLSMGSGYIVEYYPVEIRPLDILQVILTILIVGIGISWLAVRRLKVNKLSMN